METWEWLVVIGLPMFVLPLMGATFNLIRYSRIWECLSWIGFALFATGVMWEAMIS